MVIPIYRRQQGAVTAFGFRLHLLSAYQLALGAADGCQKVLRWIEVQVILVFHQHLFNQAQLVILVVDYEITAITQQVPILP